MRDFPRASCFGSDSRKQAMLEKGERDSPSPPSKDLYLLEVLCPSLRRRSCNLRRRTAGVLGLNATRYHSGWLRSLASHASVVGSALGWRATFSRIAA